MKRCVTTSNLFLQRRALGWLLRACQGSPALEPVHLRRVSSHVQPPPAANRFHKSVPRLCGSGTLQCSSRTSAFRCKVNGGAHQRQPVLCPSWHHRTAGVSTQALSAESDGQHVAVHKCVVGHLTDALGDELADCLMEMGASAATVERSGEGYPSSDTSGTAVVAFFTHDTSQDERRGVVQRSARMAGVPEPLALSWGTVSHNDWMEPIKAAFTPVEVTEKLWIVPQPDPSGLSRASVPQDAAVQRVLLQPSSAWGDGGHPTTRMILQWLNSTELQGKFVLDYGCGTGVLGISAALLGAKRVVGLDIDPDAVHASELNAQLNSVEDQCCYYACEPVPPESPSVDDFQGADGSFDICVANIFQKDLINLRDSICRLVRPGGTIVMSGVLQCQADDVIAAYAPRSCSSAVVQSEGWVMIRVQLHTSDAAQ